MTPGTGMFFPANNYYMHVVNGSYTHETVNNKSKTCVEPTATDNIVTRLLPFIHDEMRIPAGLIMDTIDEIERLRTELKDADDDFHALKAMFDKMRAEVRGE